MVSRRMSTLFMLLLMIFKDERLMKNSTGLAWKVDSLVAK